MEENKILSEQDIEDIILCEPITRKGKEALERIGLTTEDITPNFFYSFLRVSSKYDKDKQFIDKEFDPKIDNNSLYYQYTLDKVQFKELKERFKKFNLRFCSNSPNEYPLLMLGVAGNGKSIEINRLIREVTDGESEIERDRVYFDLEEAFTKTTYGVQYQCPSNSPLWLFCIKLLDGIMKYIKHCYLSCPTVLENFNNFVIKNNLATTEQKNLFQLIGNYSVDDNEKETEIFGLLNNFLSFQDASNDIQILLETLMWVMYCSNPYGKKYIVIDNIEQYIKLNNSKIQIPNSDISSLYKSINMVVMNMIYSFGRIEKDLGWKAFKIIIVLRRTSIGLLDSTLLHSPVRIEQNITDITGYFQLSDIWEKKEEYVWKKFLCTKFTGNENDDIIKIAEYVMKDNAEATGMDYQSIIAPLMSYGIRRNAKAQAHAIISTYEILSQGTIGSINIQEFYSLMSAISKDNSTIRYMFRRALIEFQYKWSISSGNEDRWNDLGIGHISKVKKINYRGRDIIVQNIAYFGNENVTLMRRILSCLSNFTDEKNKDTNGQRKMVVDMFSTLSIYNLIKGVLINPRGDDKITDDDFIQLSKVLIALSDMSNGDTKSAPYVILGIYDTNFHLRPDASVLSKILKDIWEAGEEKSELGQKYNCSDYGARITDAGYSFLLDWQASFSFCASLHCFTIPSLFFLKDIIVIKYVIETVYNESLRLCKKYEDEAVRFCGVGITLKTGTYLLKHNNKYITFKDRVRKLHVEHLTLYRTFIEKNYDLLSISESDMLELTKPNVGFINRYIKKYNEWAIVEDETECF